LLLFAFVGIEVALMPSGEVKNPARTVPRAIYLALAVTTVLYLLIQLVAQGILGNSLGKFPTAPLAQAASRFLGEPGRNLMLTGASVSAFGFLASDILSSPRILFALGRDRFLFKAFAHVHPRFRTPGCRDCGLLRDRRNPLSFFDFPTSRCPLERCGTRPLLSSAAARRWN
jgi:amino acid transporter